MPQRTHSIVLPELGLRDVRITASVWFAELGGHVMEGERLLEVAAGDVIVDVPAPISGRLVEQLVAEDELLQTGQILGIIAAAQ